MSGLAAPSGTDLSGAEELLNGKARLLFDRVSNDPDHPDGLRADSSDSDSLDLAGQVLSPTVIGLPQGYRYGVTRYADIILEQAFGQRFKDLLDSLRQFRPTLDELRAGGGGRTVFVRRFDDSIAAHTQGGIAVWGKRNITIAKSVGFDDDRRPVLKVRGHEIDMFGSGSLAEPFPGIAVETEWNNKDPFYDRDLLNFQALHHEGAIAVGVIVTRGPRLQELIGATIRSKDGGFKYGQSTTHWNKLVPRVNLGGGGQCPLFLVGIEPERIPGIELAQQVKTLLEEADSTRQHWRSKFSSYKEAQTRVKQLRDEALDLVPPVADASPKDGDVEPQ